MSASKENLMRTLKLMLSNASFHENAIELNSHTNDFISGFDIERACIDFIEEEENVSQQSS